MEQIFIRCAREISEKKLDEGQFAQALEIMEALEAAGEPCALTPFCRKMKGLEDMAQEKLSQGTRLREAVTEQYRVSMMLGEGGQSWNYLVRDARDRMSAMKVLKRPYKVRPDLEPLFRVPNDAPYYDERGLDGIEGEARMRFLRSLVEPFLLQRFAGHPNVVAMEDWFFARTGENVYVHILTEPLLPLAFYTGGDAARLGLDICEAICAMHRDNTFHRDVKLENIFVDREGRFKLGDLGSAIVVSDGAGADGARWRMSASSSDDTIPAFNTVRPLRDTLPSDIASPAELAACDIRGLGFVMADLFLRVHADQVKGTPDRPRTAREANQRIWDNHELFDASELGRIIRRAVDTSGWRMDNGWMHQGYDSAEEMREALMAVAGERRDVREDFDRFFRTDCRARLMVEYPFGGAKLYDGRPVEHGGDVRFVLMHHGFDEPSSITVTRTKTLLPGEMDAVWRQTGHDFQPYGECGRRVVNPNQFVSGGQTEIIAQYPDGYEARWTVDMVPDPMNWIDGTIAEPWLS